MKATATATAYYSNTYYWALELADVVNGQP